MGRSLGGMDLPERFCPTISNVSELFEEQVQRTGSRMAVSV